MKNYDTYQNIANDLATKFAKNKIVVFCGAGISFNSGIPLVKDFVTQILKLMQFTSGEIEIIKRSMQTDLTFEAFIEIFHEASSISRLLDVYNVKQPNTNHILLAKLVKKGFLKTICTTNFDQLIEKALFQEKLQPERDYEIIDSHEKLDRIDWNKDKIRVIKLHGTINKKSEMVITLERVGKRDLINSRKDVIDYIFSEGSHSDVLILGYSCSDIFDISPQIEAIEKNFKNILLIDHLPFQKDKNIMVEYLDVDEENNPFRHYKRSVRIRCDTDVLIKHVWELCLEDIYILNKMQEGRHIWKTQIGEWYTKMEKKYTIQMNYTIPNAIFASIKEYEYSKKYSQKALEYFEKIGDEKNRAIFLNALATAYIGLKEFEIAKEHLKLALDISKSVSDKTNEVAILANLAVISLELKDLSAALHYSVEGAVIAKENGISSAEMDFLGHLGCICYDNGDYKGAKIYFEQALQISTDTGRKYMEKGLMSNLANACRMIGNHHDSIKYYEQTIKWFRYTRNRLLEAQHIGHLGIVYFDHKDYDNALRLYNQALYIQKEIGDKVGSATNIVNIGNVYYKFGFIIQAVERYLTAREIFRKEFGDSHEFVLILDRKLEIAKKYI